MAGGRLAGGFESLATGKEGIGAKEYGGGWTVGGSAAVPRRIRDGSVVVDTERIVGWVLRAGARRRSRCH